MPSPASNTAPLVEDEINLRDYWRVLIQRRWLVLWTVCAAILLTVIIVLLLPNIYQGKTVLIPLGQPSSPLQSALGELGGVLNLGPVSSESPATRLLAILQSRTLAEAVIQQIDLLPRLFPRDWDATKQQWKIDPPPTMEMAVKVMAEAVISIWDETKGVIILTAEHTDRGLAAAIANQYIETLQRILNENAFTLAKKNRVFIEAQLQKIRQDLIVAEEALQQFEQTHGIVALDAQAQAAVTALASLEAQIMAKEVQLGVWQRMLTGSSREVYLLREELKELRVQLTRLQQGGGTSTAASETRGEIVQALLSLDKAPEVKLQYARLQREALIQNKLFTLLAQQLEQGKIEEARDETAFQVLDRAIPPETNVRPKRPLLIILGMVLGTFLGIFLAFFFEYMDTTVRTRKQVEQHIGTALLAVIPPPSAPQHHWQRGTHHEPDLVLDAPRGSPVVEALCHLHTCLKRLKGEHGVQAVLLVSAGPDEAATVAIANLAIVAARLGDRTLLVDSNLHQPTLHSFFHCALAPGLMENLTSNSQVPTVQATSVDNLYLMPAGAVTLTTFAPLESTAFDALLVRCKEVYDLILCTAPPVLPLTDAVVLSSKVDATCLVLTYGVSRVETVIEARTALEVVKANVIGAVLAA